MEEFRSSELISASQTELGIRVLKKLQEVEKHLLSLQVTNPDDEYKLSVAIKQVQMFIKNMDVTQPNADRFTVASNQNSVLIPNASVAMPLHIQLLQNVKA